MPSSVGLRAHYPYLPLPEHARAYLAAARPFTFVAVLVGVACALSIALQTHAVTFSQVMSNWPQETLVIISILLVQLGSNYLNQSSDSVEDKINKQYRVVPSGLLTTTQLDHATILTWTLALALTTFTSLPLTLLILALIVLSHAYSAPPLRLKAKPWLGNLGVAIARGQLGIVTAWAVFTPPTTLTPWLIGLALAIWTTGAITSKDFSDAQGDAAAGVQTLVVKYGADKAARISLPFVLSPFITLPILGTVYHVHMNILATGISLLLCAVLALTLIVYHDKQNRILEGNRVWGLYYTTFATLMLTFAIP